MRIAVIFRVLLLVPPWVVASGCDTKMVRTWYDVPNYQRHYNAGPGAGPVCREAATQLCPRVARIAAWPTDVRCADAEWEYADHC